jgi:hypothetical protein
MHKRAQTNVSSTVERAGFELMIPVFNYPRTHGKYVPEGNTLSNLYAV